MEFTQPGLEKDTETPFLVAVMKRLTLTPPA